MTKDEFTAKVASYMDGAHPGKVQAINSAIQMVAGERFAANVKPEFYDAVIASLDQLPKD